MVETEALYDCVYGGCRDANADGAGSGENKSAGTTTMIAVIIIIVVRPLLHPHYLDPLLPF